MHGPTLPRILAATALAAAALGATPLAQASTRAPQKHPEIIGVLARSEIIGVLKHHDLITIRKAGG